MIDTTNFTGVFMESETKAGGQIDCQVINFLRTYWGTYKGYKTMIAKSWHKNNIELRSFNSHGQIISSEHFSKKKVLKLISDKKIILEKI